jgi:hypothetical protein
MAESKQQKHSNTQFSDETRGFEARFASSQDCDRAEVFRLGIL